jgi:tetratricopeptide (TPR) repeat protein
LLTAIVTLAQRPQLSQTADELRDLAKQERKSGDLQGEANHLCQAAKLDPKKYQKKCDKAIEDLQKTLAQFQADLDTGRAEIQRKDYAGAVRDLSKITFGPDKEQAQAMIVQARIEGGLLPPEQVSQLALAAAGAAYAHGDVDKAEEMLKRVQSPSMKASANQLEANINLYRTTMKQAEAFTQSGDFKGAAEKYQAAATILPNGPGQPLEHARNALDAQAKADQERARQASLQQQLQQAQAPAESPQAKGNSPEKIKGILRVAHREEVAGNLKGALQAYESVLKLDNQQADASSGKQRVLAQMRNTEQSLEADLIEGITESTHQSSTRRSRRSADICNQEVESMRGRRTSILARLCLAGCFSPIRKMNPMQVIFVIRLRISLPWPNNSTTHLCRRQYRQRFCPRGHG